MKTKLRDGRRYSNLKANLYAIIFAQGFWLQSGNGQVAFPPPFVPPFALFYPGR